MINTKDIPGGGGGKTPKTLQPGNTVIKVNSIYLEDFKFSPGAFNLMLDCEGTDLGADFEGFFIDKNNEELGRHKGQVGRVRASEWAYADKELPNDVTISRNLEIVKFLKSLSGALGCLDWLESQNDKHATIEALVFAFNEEAPFKDKFLKVCLCGKEYENKAGYINYDLFFPKFTKAGFPFENADTVDGASKVYAFNKESHIRVKKVKSVESFEAASTDDTPNFEL